MPPSSVRVCPYLNSLGPNHGGTDSYSRPAHHGLLAGDADEVLPVNGGAAAGGDVSGASRDTD